MRCVVWAGGWDGSRGRDSSLGFWGGTTSQTGGLSPSSAVLRFSLSYRNQTLSNLVRGRGRVCGRGGVGRPDEDSGPDGRARQRLREATAARVAPHSQPELKGLASSQSKEGPRPLPFLPPTHNPLGAIGYCQ